MRAMRLVFSGWCCWRLVMLMAKPGHRGSINGKPIKSGESIKELSAASLISGKLTA